MQIDLTPGETDDDGELISDEALVAFIGTEKFTGERVFSIWEKCGDKPINDIEFRRLAGLPAQVDLTRDVIT